ncbi:hypothetical protein BpHYR1_033496 [Brachionus plicatilis]|uniref:Uncharacterized protein n=1 Tax=Brachionus plicatilis TaxID=10195 RepID=A0A3M7QW30_BRAPC|nr:hypothetical protein BpHYR1_033496 [Brachionus plicatilis]
MNIEIDRYLDFNSPIIFVTTATSVPSECLLRNLKIFKEKNFRLRRFSEKWSRLVEKSTSRKKSTFVKSTHNTG